MKRRTLTSIAAVPVFLATAVARAQAPAAPPADAPPAAPPPAATPAPEPPPPPPKPAAPPAMTAGAVNKFALQVYGFAELDTWYDNVLNAPEGLGNSNIAKAGTQFGNHGRWVWTAANSRFGFRVNAPEWEGMKSSANIEVDFGSTVAGGGVNGYASAAAAQGGQGALPYSNSYGNEANFTLNRTLRIRHAYVKLETPYVDVVAGQTWDLFGWGVVPFIPNGAEYQGITGQIFRREPILKLSHKFTSDAVNVEIAVAGVRPFQRDSQVPDGQAGLKLEFPGWKGVHVVGAGKPSVDSATIGLSGALRTLKIPPYANPMSPTYDLQTKHGYGASFDLFLPIYGATIDDQSNAVALTGEVAYTAAMTDLYGGLGSAGLPTAATPWVPVNAMGMPPVTVATPYPQNFDSNILAWTGTEFVPIKMLGITAGLQYHLPFYNGKLMWISSNFGFMKLQDVSSYKLTMGQLGGAYKQNLYNDGNVFFSLGPAANIALNYATYQITYQDDSKSKRLQRVMFAMYFFF